MNINDKLNEAIKSLDQNQLRKFAVSQAGKELVKNLTEEDKKKLLKEFNRLDANKIRRKLNEMNNGKLSSMSTDEIIKKLKEIK